MKLVNIFILILFCVCDVQSQNLDYPLFIMKETGKSEYSGNIKFGFKNSIGQVVVPYIYDWIPRSVDMSRMEFFSNPRHIFLGEFNEGLALVFKKDKGYGFINTKGKEIIPCQYNSALAFSEGLAPVQNQEGRWGYIDTKGNLVIKYLYSWPQQFNEGIACVSMDNENFNYIDTKGVKINRFPFKFGNHHAVFANGTGSVSIEGKIGYIDMSGNQLVPCIYDYGTMFFKNGQAIVKKNGKYGSIDKNGKVIIPFRQEFINGWFNTFGKFSYSSFWNSTERKGIIRDDGKIIISDNYKRIEFENTSESIIVQNNEGLIAIFDLNGNQITPFIFEDFKGFGEGLYAVRKNGLYGYVGTDGTTTIPFEFEDCDPFKYGVGLTYIKKGGFWNIINRHGEPQTIWCDETEIERKAQECVNNQINTEIDTDVPLCKPTNTNSFCLIIGNEEYMETSIPSVKYAMRDAESVKQYFTNTLGIPESNVKFLKNATLSQINSGVNWLSKIVDAYGTNTSILIYYSGHGCPDPKTGSSYILPSDGNQRDSSTLYDLNRIYSLLGDKNLNGCFVFLDACFTGKSREGNSFIDSRSISIKNKKPVGANLFVLSATNADEAAYTFSNKGHGIFTYYLLKAFFDSNGNISLRELSNYVIEQTMKTSIVENGISQTPTLSFGINIDMKKSLRNTE